MQQVFEFDDIVLSELALEWGQSETTKGQIYTDPIVIRFILNLLGDGSEQLKNKKFLEPSCGEGEFILEITKRLIRSSHGKPRLVELYGTVTAYDIVSKSIDIAKKNIGSYLKSEGYKQEEINPLLESWFHHGDFLLSAITDEFDYVVGNPPYVRVENIPKPLLREYRARYSSMGNRADLYIPFFEKSLSLLKAGGKLNFICTDRWTKNTYGKQLRQIISRAYNLDLFVDLYGGDFFHKKVSTYPAITQISNRNGKAHQTVVAYNPNLSDKTYQHLRDLIDHKNIEPLGNIQIRDDIVCSDHPWLITADSEINLIRKLEAKFPLLEDVGCKVHIGAATGCNDIFVVKKDQLDVEPSRLLPVITAEEVKDNEVQWKERYIINTYDQNGVIDLEQFPKLLKYLEAHKERLSNRHVAKKSPKNWFKTIDRVYPERAATPKLLIPDIKSKPVIIYDEGLFHPNNSIYYIISKKWDIFALRAVLLSGMSQLFVKAYTTKIANGYFRFQAQYLRKIRIPEWDAVNKEIKAGLIKAGRESDFDSCTYYVSLLYELTEAETLQIRG
ncbi:MAG: hypothetical protein COB67_03450 [SAR324 cluster bacterium]|uniref:site-specific DNA-methyltransferase (adenine-specific) n=1 Tax=SAR324 cluster bacterium TaxID=2024889 RepID=A0A2A4T7Y7_9DELT|nr:MAG: hypothetical protein COB67_03450 [SAR324 cluster bacterium]